MKVEKVLIHDIPYYHFTGCEDLKILCGRCCFAKKNKDGVKTCRLPFACEPNSFYTFYLEKPIEIGDAKFVIDVPPPPESDKAFLAKHSGAVAEQRPTERSEKEADDADKEPESKQSESKEPEGEEAEEKETGKANGADAIVLDKADKNFVFTGAFKADRIKREGNIGKRSYYAFPNGVEAEDICRYLPFNLGNVVKYVCRAGQKDPAKRIDDLEKAKDYLENEIERAKEELGVKTEGAGMGRLLKRTREDD